MPSGSANPGVPLILYEFQDDEVYAGWELYQDHSIRSNNDKETCLENNGDGHVIIGECGDDLIVTQEWDAPINVSC